MSDLITYLEHELGKPERPDRSEAGQMNFTPRDLPLGLIEFWQRVGLGSYQDDFFWTCDPSTMKANMKDWLAAALHRDIDRLQVIGYTATNIVYVLSDRDQLFRVDLNWARIIVISDTTSFPDYIRKMPPLDALTAIALTYWRNEDQAMHRLAVERVGNLRRGEVYGFVPALQIGGAYSLRNVRIVAAAEHWAILSELLPFSYFAHGRHLKTI